MRNKFIIREVIQNFKAMTLEKQLFYRLKANAKQNKVKFSLSVEDIVLPDVCPVYKVPFIYKHSLWTYSFDRVDNSKGYIKGNVRVISRKANRQKSDMSIEDLERIINYMKSHQA